MKYLTQFGVIMAVAALGEILRYLLPFPIPATVYGLVLMLIFLLTKVIKLSWVKETSAYLLEIMPIMFVPPAVALISTWGEMRDFVIPVVVISVVSTFVVLFVTGKVTDLILLRGGGKDE